MMTPRFCLLPAAALLLWSGAAAAQRLPDRRQVEAAVNAWFACSADQDCAGLPAYRRQLTRARCHRLPPQEEYPGRILCIFSGVDTGSRIPAPRRFRNDCVYMMPSPGRGWRVSSIPDADVCE